MKLFSPNNPYALVVSWLKVHMIHLKKRRRRRRISTGSWSLSLMVRPETLFVLSELQLQTTTITISHCHHLHHQHQRPCLLDTYNSFVSSPFWYAIGDWMAFRKSFCFCRIDLIVDTHSSRFSLDDGWHINPRFGLRGSVERITNLYESPSSICSSRIILFTYGPNRKAFDDNDTLRGKMTKLYQHDICSCFGSSWMATVGTVEQNTWTRLLVSGSILILMLNVHYIYIYTHTHTHTHMYVCSWANIICVSLWCRQ